MRLRSTPSSPTPESNRCLVYIELKVRPPFMTLLSVAFSPRHTLASSPFFSAVLNRVLISSVRHLLGRRRAAERHASQTVCPSGMSLFAPDLLNF